MSASVVLKGYVNKDVQKRESKNGNKFLKFSMSIRNRSNANTEKEDKNFYPLVFLFEDPNQPELPDLQEGNFIACTGQLTITRPTVKGEKAYNNIVVYADAVEDIGRPIKE